MANVTDPQTAVLAARMTAMEIRLARAGLLGSVRAELPVVDRARLVVGPDDLENDPDVVVFQGFDVLRVDHWQGEPTLVLPAGDTVASAYEMARRLQEAGITPARIRAFGPAGWEHVSLPLLAAPQHRVDFVPADGIDGPMIGVELT